MFCLYSYCCSFTDIQDDKRAKLNEIIKSHAFVAIQDDPKGNRRKQNARTFVSRESYTSSSCNTERNKKSPKVKPRRDAALKTRARTFVSRESHTSSSRNTERNKKSPNVKPGRDAALKTEVRRGPSSKQKAEEAETEATAMAKALLREMKPPLKTSRLAFPERIFKLLKRDEVKEHMWWLPGGDAFCLVPSRLMQKNVLDKYFGGASWGKFTAELSLYGFRKVLELKVSNAAVNRSDKGTKRLTSIGLLLTHFSFQEPRDTVVYCHKFFNKEKPHWLKHITINRRRGAKAHGGRRPIVQTLHDAASPTQVAASESKKSSSMEQTVPTTDLSSIFQPATPQHHTDREAELKVLIMQSEALQRAAEMELLAQWRQTRCQNEVFGSFSNNRNYFSSTNKSESDRSLPLSASEMMGSLLFDGRMAPQSLRGHDIPPTPTGKAAPRMAGNITRGQAHRDSRYICRNLDYEILKYQQEQKHRRLSGL